MRLTRRGLLRRALGAFAVGGAAVAAACTEGASDDADDRETGDTDVDETDTDGQSAPWCDVANPGQGAGWMALALADHPELREVGGSVQLTLGGQRVNVAHVEEGCYVAMGTVCTHEGCTVEVRSGPRFVCPCHGALFGWDGIPIAGPAFDPLPTFEAGRDGETVYVRVG